ncbi:GTPase and tRNA-U34 5-formylation enzyme TrmE [gamma proteobacterium IMCC2047]|nr:GTPase and tRNA-U34 5-formylation enzyme TrmE [gamma proteobacterium IMCC2047]
MIDQGVALLFTAPASFTGEHVLELQGHGGQVVMDLLLKEIIKLGARQARPGEFSERAFLNNKIDLTQAEAIADLIDSSSEQAARNAVKSLQGEFSKRIHDLVEALIMLRMYVEAAIDFPEEEIDFLADSKVGSDLNEVIQRLGRVLVEAHQGAALQEGMNVVMAGLPNAGKSSLLNRLSGKDSAIVINIPGTTRDVLREHIHIDGMPLHIIDPAGLRDSPDEIEQEGIRRAWSEIKKADRILLVVDASNVKETHPHDIWPDFVDHLEGLSNITVIQNKCDLLNVEPAFINAEGDQSCPVIRLSAKQGEGIDLLTNHLKDCMGYQAGSEGNFSARRRHLDALERAQTFLETGQRQLQAAQAGELLAEDLRQAQQCLSEITGEFSSDDLLGRIFSSFCIGK